MNLENIYIDLTDYTENILQDGINSPSELKHARKLANAAMKYIEAFDEIESELDEDELKNSEDDDFDTDEEE